METHISWVVLAGGYAYKIKKPVDLGFLDFSSLDKRRFYCEEELRLNGRLSPDIYLEVVPVTGTRADPAIQGAGAVVDYAVKMRRFSQDALLDRRLGRDQVDAAVIDRMADEVATFHGTIPAAPVGSPRGAPERTLAPALENLRHLQASAPKALAPRMKELEAWTRVTFETLEPVLRARRDNGFVRECHGDMHLGNMAWVNGGLRIFDGIEFSAELRWIDVMSEATFVVTDLQHRGRPDFAWRFLNRYLETTGDYPGLALLAYYRVYRLMVRAKVAAIRLGQLEPDSREARFDHEEVERYVDQAREAAAPRTPALILTRGISGSGKSWLSQGLVEYLGAVRLRSDVERKRLFGLPRDGRSSRRPGAGIYTAGASRRTFGRLRELAAHLLDAGHTVIVDATFLGTDDRRPFRDLAAERGCGFLVLDIRVPAATARRRVGAREDRGDDPSEAGVAVLERQLEDYGPLPADELGKALHVDGEHPPRMDRLAAAVSERLGLATG